MIVDKQKLNELRTKEEQKVRKAQALIIAGLFTLSFCAFWMLLEYSMTGAITPDPLHDIVTIPVAVSFYFNAKGIVAKYFK